jgi:hypothetical protein
MAIIKLDISMLEDVSGANNLVKLDANAKIPAGTGTNLLNKPGPFKSTSDPTISSNKTLGTEWINTTSGEVYICTDATAGANTWTNVGPGSGNVAPETWYGGRGIFGGGHYNSYFNVIDYVTIATPGNSTDFGNLTVGRGQLSGLSSGTRGVFVGGYTGSYVDTIDYITIATLGNAIDFGNLDQIKGYPSACSSGYRGLILGGQSNSGAGDNHNIISYITIATPGNSTDFGDLTVGRMAAAACNNETRGVCGGGSNGNVIDYVTIATTGNATDFGDRTISGYQLGACSNTTRGIFGGGNDTVTNTIDYITIATIGNATDFGDLTTARTSVCSTSNNSRGIFSGGLPYAQLTVIDYVTIATTGNATDFGDSLVRGSDGRLTKAGACSGA